MTIVARTLCAAMCFLGLSCAAVCAGEPQYVQAQMQSPQLSAFWGQPVSFDAHVLLPDSYYRQPAQRYPVIYWIQGFGGTGNIDSGEALIWQKTMRRLHRQFIIVYLDGMFNGGHQEFADSANNGPWGSALTKEFIPRTEANFRGLDDAHSRFVAGHSSGGWSALWLQITYPEMFAAEWSLSPDPVDFSDFTGPDLYRNPLPNFFVDSTGKDYEVGGLPMKQLVADPDFGRPQFNSFDNVFSPKGADGNAEPLFNRKTGVIDAAVARYWTTHYDIAAILKANWPTLGPKLRGKLHIFVGAKDSFHLDRPVALLRDELRTLGSDAQIEIVPGLNHRTIYSYKGNAIDYIVTSASEMLSAP
ncbi:MAG: esterase family protein [Candidatus Eremiobacteraeota bacterium]|nr:esterase family protein [Candidatus Eremiobacteraeota bacterium]